MRKLALFFLLLGLACGQSSAHPAGGGSGGSAAAGSGGLGGSGGSAGSGGAALCTVCTDDGDEDCLGCFQKLGACCHDDATYMGHAEQMAEVCARSACRTCCNECAALTCDQIKARGDCFGILQ